EIQAETDLDRPIGELSTGQEQIVQIAAAVGTGAQVIIMDEPTSSLSIHESEHLFRLLDHLRQRGITVIYVSHRMEEIFRLCDTVTVLRDGRHIATEKTADTNPDRVVQQMIGREDVPLVPSHLSQTPGDEILQGEDLSSPGQFHHASFSLRAGDVLAFAALASAGRSAVTQATFSLEASD